MAIELQSARGAAVAEIITGNSQGSLETGVTVNGTTIEALGVNVDSQQAIFSVRATTRHSGGLPQITAASVALPLSSRDILDPHDVKIGPLPLDGISDTDMPKVATLFAALHVQSQSGEDGLHVVSATPFGVIVDVGESHLPAGAPEGKPAASILQKAIARRLVAEGASLYNAGPFQAAFASLEKSLT